MFKCIKDIPESNIDKTRDRTYILELEELEKSTSMIKMSEQTENDLRKYAVRTGIIPNDYINARFKPEIIRKNINIAQYYAGIDPASFVFNGSR